VAVRAIVTVPDPRLRIDCAAVADFDSHLTAFARDMFDTMYAAPGQGLAAPQLGLAIRVFVTDTGWPEGKSAPLAMVNPVIRRASVARQICDESCLSIPGAARRIARPAEVVVAWQDLNGAAQEGRFLGIAAVAIQHEMDHLNGIMMTDHPETPEPAKLRL
jgi:peptide deformylase